MLTTGRIGPAHVRLAHLGGGQVATVHNRGLLGSGHSRLVHRCLSLIQRGVRIELHMRRKVLSTGHGFIVTQTKVSRTTLGATLVTPGRRIKLVISRGGIVDIRVPAFASGAEATSRGSVCSCKFTFASDSLSKTIGSLSSVLPSVVQLTRYRGTYRLVTTRVRGAEHHMGTLRRIVVPRARRDVGCVAVGLSRGRHDARVQLVGIGSVVLRRTRRCGRGRTWLLGVGGGVAERWGLLFGGS